MDSALLALLIMAIIYLAVYFIGSFIGFDKLSKRGIDANTPFFFMWRTERLNAFLTKAGKKVPRRFFDLGIVVAFVGMGAGFWLFADNFLKFFIAPEEAGGVVPIIPGVTVTGLQVVYLLIGLAVTLVTHEFAHGLAASRDDIPIKSSGLLLFTVLFGAFVEADDEYFEQEATPQSRMRMLSAGSYSNFIWAGIFLVILMNVGAILSVGFTQPGGAYVYSLEDNSPAASALEVGDVIIGLNDTQIDSWNNVSVFMLNASAGDVLTIHTLEGSVTIVLAAREANSTSGYIGIYGTADTYVCHPLLPDSPVVLPNPHLCGPVQPAPDSST
jgi:membrane-associated protease RseP (regulator of RpoE activity)